MREDCPRERAVRGKREDCPRERAVRGKREDCPRERAVRGKREDKARGAAPGRKEGAVAKPRRTRPGGKGAARCAWINHSPGCIPPHSAWGGAISGTGRHSSNRTEPSYTLLYSGGANTPACHKKSANASLYICTSALGDTISNSTRRRILDIGTIPFAGSAPSDTREPASPAISRSGASVQSATNCLHACMLDNFSKIMAHPCISSGLRFPSDCIFLR